MYIRLITDSKIHVAKTDRTERIDKSTIKNTNISHSVIGRTNRQKSLR